MTKYTFETLTTALTQIVPGTEVSSAEDGSVLAVLNGPLYCTQVVSADLEAGTLGWAGEQEAGPDVWDALLLLGFRPSGEPADT